MITNQLQQKLREKIEKILTNQWGENGRECFDDAIDELCSLFTTELEKHRNVPIEENIPMGVSQWMTHGKKFGYWKYFLDKEIIEYLKSHLSQKKNK